MQLWDKKKSQLSSFSPGLSLVKEKILAIVSYIVCCTILEGIGISDLNFVALASSFVLCTVAGRSTLYLLPRYASMHLLLQSLVVHYLFLFSILFCLFLLNFFLFLIDFFSFSLSFPFFFVSPNSFPFSFSFNKRS